VVKIILYIIWCKQCKLGLVRSKGKTQESWPQTGKDLKKYKARKA